MHAVNVDGHFQITFSLTFQVKSGALLLYENEFHLHVNENLNFSMKGSAPDPALKMRVKTTRKKPVFDFFL